MLRDAGWYLNDKRVERLWRREGLEGSHETAEAMPAVAQ